MDNYQQKGYVFMKFIPDVKHTIFKDIGKGEIRKFLMD